MDPNSRLLMLGSGGAAVEPGLNVEDVFSTYLYTGNGGSQTITNGIDLAGEGGLVWIKNRSSTTNNFLLDTARGTNSLISNFTDAQGSLSLGWVYNSNGFTQNNSFGAFNQGGENYASWTFRKAPGFFDIVTYTGTGSPQNINHNLGSVPGMIITKKLSGTSNWAVYHRGVPAGGHTGALILNAANTFVSSSAVWDNTPPTSTTFRVGTADATNVSGQTYVAYLFAHDEQIFGAESDESIIQCGSYVGNGSTQTISLGWEPQWLLVKNIDNGAYWWWITDNMRGLHDSDDNDPILYPNDSATESSSFNYYTPLTNGFRAFSDASNTNNTYIYVAIRRGFMGTPTDASKVFDTIVHNGTTSSLTVNLSNTPDLFIQKGSTGGPYPWYVLDRKRGQGRWFNINTANEATGGQAAGARFDVSNGFRFASASDGFSYVSPFGAPYASYSFSRANGFLDIVTYNGSGSSTQPAHALGVVPEFIIVKKRTGSGGYDWICYHSLLGATQGISFNSTGGAYTDSAIWNNTAPTATTFSLGTSAAVNGSGNLYVAYLFASCPGVSKVGSYTGTAATLNIDCGFASGASFVMIKRVGSGDWYVWDSARGIVSGNDPYHVFNTTANQVTNTDYIDPLSSGFQISSSAPAAINASGGSFIFLAIA